MPAGFIGFKVTRALIARFLFALHSLTSIWILYSESRNIYYWAFAASPILLFVEGAITIVLRHGDEYKWFCPSVFLFLCGSVPPIWLLEFTTTYRAVNNITQAANSASLVVDIKWIGYIMFELPQLPGQMWLQVVEQSLLVILILGRWLLPKGRITRDELSQLLLAYLAISADIVELFNLFQEQKVRMNMKLSLMVLAFWSVSLTQFPFVITTVKSQKARYCFSTQNVSSGIIGDPLLSPISQKTFTAESSGEASDAHNDEHRHCCKRFCKKVCDVRVWGILSTIVLQDLPFWALRIYLIFYESVMSYTMFFFICKNSLIMWVQLYRLIIICGEQQEKNSYELPISNNPKLLKSQNAQQQMHLLHPQYYSPFTSPEKRRPLDDVEAGNVDPPPVPLLSMLELEDDQLPNKLAREQNGSAPGVASPEASPPLSPDLDPRRPSFNITGTVSAQDLLAQTKNRRNALTDFKNEKINKKTLLQKKYSKGNDHHKNSIVLPTIKLASPDTLEDL